MASNASTPDDEVKVRRKRRERELQDSRVLRMCSFNLEAAYVEVGRPRKGLDYLQRAQPGPKVDRLPDLQFNLGLAYNALGQSREVASHFLQAAQLYRSQGDGGSEGDACMEMSRYYSRTQDWALAAHSFLRAAKSYKVAAMLESAATALKDAGNHMIQLDQFSHEDIIAVLTECLSLRDRISHPRTLSELYLLIGVSYCWLRCFDEAVQCCQQALGPAAQCPPLLAKVLHNLGAALNSVGQFNSAAGYHRLAAGLYGPLGCHADQARCFSNMAFACSQLGDEEEAAESLIHALQGFTEDHLAQVQVCESLAECYLKQSKQQKAVELYKQALSALSHCKDSAVQDQLVERLTSALQQSLAIKLQKPCPLGPRPPRPHPHSSLVKQHFRRSDITHTSPGRPSNQQQDKQRWEGPGAKSTGRQEAPEPCGFAVGGATDGPVYMSIAPGLHSSDQSDQSDKQQHSKLWLDKENPHTDSETSLVQETEARPTIQGKIREVTLPVGSWRSRFCSLM